VKTRAGCGLWLAESHLNRRLLGTVLRPIWALQVPSGWWPSRRSKWKSRLDCRSKRTTIRDVMAVRGRPRNSCSSRMICRPNGRRPISSPCRPAAILSWEYVVLCALAMALLAVPSHAQRAIPLDGATGKPLAGPINTNTNHNAAIAPELQPTSGMTALPKPPTIAEDAKCLPWNVPEVRATTVSVARLKVPPRARREFEKACEANNKNKFDEAQQYVRSAIDKFQSYAAAWVLLGLVLDEQRKTQEGREACLHATTIDPTYLRAYLCLAEFSARNQEWEQLLSLANVALGLNSEGDGYAYYYRAMAYFHMNNLIDAKRSALQAARIDLNHNYGPLYFLLAQIYDAEGDTANAAAQLRQILKHHNDRQREDATKRYLAKLESEQATK
jgi:Tetratricopeptide repeat